MPEVELGLQCQPEIAEELALSLSSVTRSEVDQVDLNNLDGSPATVLQIVQVGVSMIGAIAPIVTAYIAAKKVKKVKLGDIEIENPTQEQWESVWKDHVSHTSKAPPTK